MSQSLPSDLHRFIIQRLLGWDILILGDTVFRVESTTRATRRQSLAPIRRDSSPIRLESSLEPYDRPTRLTSSRGSHTMLGVPIRRETSPMPQLQARSVRPTSRPSPSPRGPPRALQQRPHCVRRQGLRRLLPRPAAGTISRGWRSSRGRRAPSPPKPSLVQIQI